MEVNATVQRERACSQIEKKREGGGVKVQKSTVAVLSQMGEHKRSKEKRATHGHMKSGAKKMK